MHCFCHLQRLLARSPPADTTNLGKIQRNIGPSFEADDITYNHLFDYYHAQDTSKKSPNNIVSIEVEGKLSCVKVLHILQLAETSEQLAMVQQLSEVKDEMLNPVFKKLGITRVLEGSERRFIKVDVILSPVSPRKIPAWTMGVHNPSMLVMMVTSGEQNVNPVNSHDMEEFYASQLAGDDMAMDIDTDPSMI
ncbi:uncharacterized protein MELLADRAFT_111007 [Melampsora larici-populina 98AG31]|uniref:Uncharacterized protein n=1 Tax=Melampsora larici-populina (strain 98AG31 / pathotype 3-4-7) TaxID=747676 RepID=F4S1R0_MELLP|nr:uncharacterized protein MELLADRAFT_111007 [Melampsora larici-populina 98AG31]EGG01460.1 hypothetical protein MELLADRAFT_111007 [Melampsora larici-populina 98AG31]